MCPFETELCVSIPQLITGISEHLQEKKGNILVCVGVASNSQFHAEQVVNNESSLMVSSVNAIWRKRRSSALCLFGGQRWMI